MENSHDKVLIDAINGKDLALVKASLESGANIEAPDQHGCAGLPLRRACFLGNQEIVLALLQRGANPNAANADGTGAAMRMAQRGGHTTICTLLQQYAIFSQSSQQDENPVLQADHHALFGEDFSSQTESNSALPQTPKDTEPSQKVDILLEFNIEPKPDDIPQEPDEHLEIEACYGVDTKVLLEDVARIMSYESAAHEVPSAIQPESGGFWQRIKK